jgi:hypothetical protein
MAICPTCGRSEPGKPRSLEAHNRLFAILDLFFQMWPHGHPEQFDNAEQLRKWTFLKVGHKDVIRIDLGNADPAAAVILAEAAMKAAGAYARARVIGSDLIVFRPKSIRFEAMGKHAFTKLSADIESLLELETGIKITENLLSDGVIENATGQEDEDSRDDP